MDSTYCFEKCSKGKTECEKFLQLSTSVFDAVSDFQCFIESCPNTCPHKLSHIDNKILAESAGSFDFSIAGDTLTED